MTENRITGLTVGRVTPPYEGACKHANPEAGTFTGTRSRAAGRRPLPFAATPFGFTTFPGEIWRTPRSWVEASYPNIVYFNEVDKGGNFADWEEPEVFSVEMRAAFRSLR